MKLYRGQDIGNREQLEDRCLQIIRNGAPSQIYDILPHLRILRCPSLVAPLLELLNLGNAPQKAAAALALGSLGATECIQPLREIFEKPCRALAERHFSLQAAVVTALGDTGSEQAVEPLMDIFRMRFRRDYFRTLRRRLILVSLGELARQGSVRAQRTLAQLMSDSKESIRVQAITELATAFWHCPKDLPELLLHRIFQQATRDTTEVQKAARAALTTLARLGSGSAAAYYSRLGG